MNSNLGDNVIEIFRENGEALRNDVTPFLEEVEQGLPEVRLMGRWANLLAKIKPVFKKGSK